MRFVTNWRRAPAVLVAAIGLLALLTGCAAGARTAALSPLHLDWQPMNMPAQSGTTPYTMAVAPSDGDVVYARSVDPNASLRQRHLWVTCNRSAHWMHLADLTVPASSNQCGIAVDGLEPTTAIAAVNWSPIGTVPAIATAASDATVDGGVTWRQLSGQSPYVVPQLAMRADVTHAIIKTAAPGGEHDTLATSGDRLRTWQPMVQTQRFGLGGFPSAFWLDPASNRLLVAGAKSIWHRDNGGSTWTAISPSLAPPDRLEQVVAQMPRLASLRRLGAETDWTNLQTPANGLICSFDGGQTWSPRTALNQRVSTGGQSSIIPGATVFALDRTSEVLAGIGVLPAGETFSRLAAQTQQWQVIGNTKGATSFTDEHPTSLNPTSYGEVVWTVCVDHGWFYASYP